MKTTIPHISSAVKRIPWRRIWVWSISFLVLVGIALGGLFSYASTYDMRVFPGVHIGNLPVGGMSREEVTALLEEMNTKLHDAGISLMFTDNGTTHRIRIDSTTVLAENVVELIYMDVAREVDAVLSYKKDQNPIFKGWSAVFTRGTEPHLSLTTVTFDRDRLVERLATALEPFVEEPREAGVSISMVDPLHYTIVSSTVGVTFAYDEILEKSISAWNVLEIPEVSLVQTVKEPTIHDDDVRNILKKLQGVFDTGSLDLTYTDPQTKRDNTWTMTKADIAQWIEVQRHEAGLGFGLTFASTSAFLTDVVAHEIDQEAREARFQVGENGKVNEFQGSRPGLAVDVEQTYEAVNSAVLARSWGDEGTVSSSVPIVVMQVEPYVQTGEVNDLGISEILGIGYSNFSGSPTNRIKNIKHAVEDKLNGLLIKPDEEFSLLRTLEPFTIEGGYLPELVIKGDEIKPEVAGGLCQVGTTMFRTVMNSGLPITQRRNHSLVVSYYNDHRNGQPGTDATIYDPAPDFRFKNDTGNYILLTTDMNVQTGNLYFTFWGTSDGRKGYYSEPVVHKWIPTGSEQIVETTELAPGVRNCQSAHPGAETSFTYTRVLPNGEKVHEVFSSYYRPLPKICLVGVEKIVQPVDSVPQECTFLPDGHVDCSDPVHDTSDVVQEDPETDFQAPSAI